MATLVKARDLIAPARSVIPVEPGERVLVHVHRGEGAKLTGRQAYALGCMVLPFGLLVVLFTPLLFADVLRVPSGTLLLGEIVALGVATYVLRRWSRGRVTAVLTSKRFVDRSFMGTASVPVAAVRGAHRHVARRVDRYGNVEHVDSDQAVVTLHDGSARLTGALREYDEVVGLLNAAGLRANALEHYPGVDPSPTPAERRADAVLVRAHVLEGEKYGPIFFGPTLVVRFTNDALPTAAMLALFAGVGEASGPDEGEAAVRAVADRPDAGFVERYEVEQLRVEVTEAGVLAHRAQGEVLWELHPRDTERVRAWTHQRARSPMR